MSVTERMQALGDHAKSSRQPPLRPRQTAGGDLAAGSHFIHDNALTSPPIDDDDEMNALLHQAIEDRTAEELVIPESAAIADISDAGAQLIPSEAHQAIDHLSSAKATTISRQGARSSTNGKTGQPCIRMSWET